MLGLKLNHVSKRGPCCFVLLWLDSEFQMDLWNMFTHICQGSFTAAGAIVDLQDDYGEILKNMVTMDEHQTMTNTTCKRQSSTYHLVCAAFIPSIR